MPNKSLTKTAQTIQTKRSSTGLGLFTAENIKKGTSVIEYTGTLINNTQRNKRGGKYLFEINSRLTIDGSSRANIARYINHSCRPNCEIEIKKHRVYIVTKKKINSGEELTYNYDKEYFNAYIKPFGCKCDPCCVKKKKLLRI